MKKIVDMKKWDKLCKTKIKKAKSYASFWDGIAANMQMVKEWMDNQPDAEEKRGKWGFKGTAYGCSICGEGSPAPIHRYCPNCGAKMDLGEEE